MPFLICWLLCLLMMLLIEAPPFSFFVGALQAILMAPKFHCTEEILTIVSLLSVDSVLYSPPSRRDEVQAVRKKFISSEGGHITLLNIYRAFKNTSGNRVGTCSSPDLARLGQPFSLAFLACGVL